MTTRTPSQLGRYKRAKGGKFQSDTAKALRPWYPDAVSGRDNGYRTADFTAPDTGDLARAGERLWWSLKNHEAAASLPSGMILGWLQEAREKAGGRTPLLVIKRKGHAEPLRSWCWWWLADLRSVMTDDPLWRPHDDVPVMMELQHALQVLTLAGWTDTAPEAA